MPETFTPDLVRELLNLAVANKFIRAAAIAPLLQGDYVQRIAERISPSLFDFGESNAFVGTIIIDDSDSMKDGKHVVCSEGTSGVLKSWYSSKNRDSILVQIVLLSGRPGMPLTPLTQAPAWNSQSYTSNFSHTPLCDMCLVGMGVSLVTQIWLREKKNVPAVAAMLVTSDGLPVSDPATADDVRQLQIGLMETGCCLSFPMGIGKNNEFDPQFTAMGFPPGGRLNPKSTPAEIHRAFGIFSRSSTNASMGAAEFETERRILEEPPRGTPGIDVIGNG